MRGGAYGSHVTRAKRKRKNKQNQGTNCEGTLAGALQSFLQQWTAPSPLAKKQRHVHQEQTEDMSLAQNLISIIQTCVQHQDRDEVVIQKVKSSLSQRSRPQATAYRKESVESTPWFQQESWGHGQKQQKRISEISEGGRFKKPKLSGAQPVAQSASTQPAETKAQTSEEKRSQIPNGLVAAEWNIPPKIVPKGHL